MSYTRPGEYNEKETVTLTLQRYDHLCNENKNYEDWDYEEREIYLAMKKYFQEHGLFVYFNQKREVEFLTKDQAKEKGYYFKE